MTTCDTLPPDSHSILACLADIGASLPPKTRQVAEFICQTPRTICFLSLRELARQANVGQTTVVRLVEALGFSGYADFHRVLREAVLFSHQTDTRFERASEIQRQGSSPLDPFMCQELKNLQELQNTLNTKQFEQAVDILSSAGTIVIAATRSCLPLAIHTKTVLERIEVPVELLTSLDPQYFYSMERHVPHAAVLAFGFHRYMRAMLLFLERVRKLKLPAVVFTDSHLSPFPGDVLFAVPTRQTSFFPNHCAPLVLLNALLHTVSTRHPEHTAAALKTFEQNARDNHLFISREDA